MKSDKILLFLRELLNNCSRNTESEEIKISSFKNKLSQEELVKLSQEELVLIVKNNASIKKFKKKLLIIKDFDTIQCDFITVYEHLQKIQKK